MQGDSAMNERIRELSEQAEKYADDNFRGEPTWSEAFESKFAELIVQECLAQADKIRDGCDEDDEPQQALGADWVGIAIARHFGVE